jgi:hypothetical protein
MGKLFGREPAYFMALISSAIALATGLGLDLSIDQQGALNAFVAAVFAAVTAWKLARNGSVAALVGVGKAAIAIALAFGFHLSPELQSSTMLFVELLLTGLLVWPNVTAPIREDGVVLGSRPTN